MKKVFGIIFIIFFSILFYNICSAKFSTTEIKNGKNKEEVMDTLYKKELNNDLTLYFFRSLENDLYTWQTVLLNKKTNKELILYKDVISNSDGWKEKEQIGESPVNLYLLSGSYLLDKDLYITYSIFGQIMLYKYHFTASNTFSTEQKSLLNYHVSPSYVHNISYSNFKMVDDKIVIFVSCGQDVNSRIATLFIIDLADFGINKIVFLENPIILTGTFVSETSKEWIDEIETEIKIFNTTHDKKTLDLIKELKRDVDKSFVLKRLSADEEVQYEEISELFSKGYELYYFFDQSVNNRQLNILDAENEIKKILSFLNLNNKIKVLDYFTDGSDSSLVYFFYLDHQNKLQIIRYQKDYPLWMIGSYKEEILADQLND